MIRDRLVSLVDALLARQVGATPVLSPRDEASLRDLIGALERLDEGKYGRCNACGESIGEERLLEGPTTALCPQCASDDSWRPFGPH